MRRQLGDGASMKKIITLFLAIAVIGGVTGCSNIQNGGFFGMVKKVILPDDYEEAGRMVGEAGYMAYVIMKGDPKYDKYTTKMEEIWAALQAGEKESFVMGDLNNTFLEVMRVAMTAKYGYVKGALITDGIRIGGVLADRLMADKVDTVKMELYLKGVKEGIEHAIAATPADAFTEFQKPTEEDKKIIRCPDGNCKGDLSNKRTVSYIAQAAQELLDSGYLDKNEEAPEGEHNKYENMEQLVERCKLLKKFGIKKSLMYIGEYEIKDGKCIKLDIWLEDDGKVLKVTCVGCMPVDELLEVPDAEW